MRAAGGLLWWSCEYRLECMKKKQTQLERDTTAYYESLSGEALRDEQELERAVSKVPSPDVDAPED